MIGWLDWKPSSQRLSHKLDETIMCKGELALLRNPAP